MHLPSFDIQGHRGARGLFPENTIPAFVAALDLGVPTLEMDVLVSKDHRVVVSHDPWMARAICLRPDGRRIPFVRERRFRLYEMTYDEIAAFDCGSLRHPRFRLQQNMPAAKPLLADVIDEAEAHARASGRALPFYSIETKSRVEWEGIYHPDPDTFARLLLDVLEERSVTKRSIVQSFDVRTLRAARRMNEDVRLALLADRQTSPHVDANVDALGFDPDIYSPHHESVDERMVDAVHRRGLAVIPWTVNDKDWMLELAELDVDGLITDYPDVAMRELGDRLRGEP